MKSAAFIRFMLLLAAALWILSGCNNARRLGKNQYLLKKNVVECNNRDINTEDFGSLIRQRPNKKILGLFKFHLTVYNIGNHGKENRMKRWLKKIGEEPVIIDKKTCENSAKQITKQLNNKGFFGSTVRDSLVVKEKKKKAVVYYLMKVKSPYTIRNVRYSFEDPAIAQLIRGDTAHSLIRKGENFDVDVFQAERERIAKQMKDEGYYYFSKEYVDYRVDSALKQNKVDVVIHVLSALQKVKDSIVHSPHKKYYISDVYVHTKYSPVKKDTLLYDTLLYIDYLYIYPKGQLRFKPKALNRLIFVKKGQLYQPGLPDLTYKRLTDTKGFKLVGITYADSNKTENGNNVLDCHVLLTPLPAQSYSIELEGTNSSGDLGIAGNLVYQHKNLFKSLVSYHVKLKGAMEFQSSVEADNSDLIQPFLPFNTYEYGIETGLTIPKFLLPIKPENVSKNSYPKTTLSLGYNFQERADYWRSITNGTMGYTWQESSKKKHSFNLSEINIVNIKKDTAFIAVINALNDPQIKNSYEDHLTAASSYTFLFNNQDINKTKDFNFFSARLEWAGNLMRFLSGQVFGLQQDSLGTYDWFKIKFAQYARVDADFRHYFVFDKSNSVVFRIKMGTGIPYGNIKVMPFEKSYYAGGANSIRAWTMKSLGPGSFTGSGLLDKTGDLAFESNLEYRFDITSMFKGALFADAGNIWLLNEDPNRPGAEFQPSRFLKELAVGVGLGIRLDFSFFIIRFDAGLKTLDPSMEEGKRFVLGDQKIKNINFNLGIGYPF